MSKRKRKYSRKKYRFHGIVNRLFLVKANSLRDLKRKASIAVNGYFNVIDQMTVFDGDDGTYFNLSRINRKCPWNVMFYGSWQ